MAFVMRSKRYHIIFDIKSYSCKEINRNTLKKVLSELPPLIDTQIIAGPVIVEGVKGNPGLSGFVIIDYSHISIHTFSRYDEILIDIFSCKPYIKEVVIEFLLATLGIGKTNMKIKTVSWG